MDYNSHQKFWLSSLPKNIYNYFKHFSGGGPKLPSWTKVVRVYGIEINSKREILLA